MDHYYQRMAELERAYEKYVEKCETEADPSACHSQAVAWWAQMRQRLEEMLDAAIQHHWDYLRQQQDQYEDQLRELFPGWPDLRDITLPVSDATVSIDLDGAPDAQRDPCEVMVETMRKYNQNFDQVDLGNDPQLRKLIAESPCFDIVTDAQGAQRAETLQAQSLDLSGSVTVEADGITTVITVSGTLDLAGSTNSDGSYAATVFGGALVATLSNGGSAMLEVVPDEANLLSAGTNGAGDLTVLFDATYSNEGWDAILQDLTRLRIPITRSANGAIASTVDPTSIDDIIPYAWHALSDYNEDGVLDLATDLPAFQAGLAAHADLTDRNRDGLWNSDDTDLWTLDFLEDLSHQ